MSVKQYQLQAAIIQDPLCNDIIHSSPPLYLYGALPLASFDHDISKVCYPPLNHWMIGILRYIKKGAPRMRGTPLLWYTGCLEAMVFLGDQCCQIAKFF